MSEQAPKLKTLYWAFKLLECFDYEHERLSVTELSKMMSIPKSSICNALSTFEQLGYIRKHTSSGKYSLGPKVACLYHAYCSRNSDSTKYQRECRILSDRLDVTVGLGACVNDKVICLASACPPRYPQATLVGREYPLHATAIGKAIMAFMPAEQQERVYMNGLLPFTRNTITDKKGLDENLELIRARDYAVDIMEFESNMCSVAVPIWRTEGRAKPPKYAIGITVPAEKLSNDQVLEYVKIILDTHKEVQNMYFLD